MARAISHPPSAACLSASMRDLGYSLETAIADLIDNSISADANEIDIFCDVSAEEPIMVIKDNGHGMTDSEMLAAMRHGAVNPKAKRSAKDLGRFGLGLKTASFSQCRSLTVISKKNGSMCGAEWDLDQIDKTDDWILNLLDDKEIKAIHDVERLGKHGTAVIWRKLDRLTEDESNARRDEIVNEKLSAVSRHLSLVFHRYLAGEIKGRPKIAISVNGHRLSPFDPFCRKNSATQMLPEEIVRVGDEEIRLQPYVLPHHSRLSKTEYDFYQDRSDFISNQGSYVYRNGRLMAWGDWFRLVPKGESTKLARVQIDFPNSLDEVWTIDIKKSRARPPLLVRERLRQIIDRITSRSITVHRGRGQKLYQESAAPFWERYVDRGGIRFQVNKQHQLVSAIEKSLNTSQIDLFNLLLESISSSLPIEMIYSDFSTNPREINQKSDLSSNEILSMLKGLWAGLYGTQHGDILAFSQIIKSTRLFDHQEDLVEKILRENFT